MKEKATVRYLGYRALLDGGRGFDFSVTPIGEKASLISIGISAALFKGPDGIAIQEGAGICYETLKSRIETETAIPCQAFSLNLAEVVQHRKTSKPAGRRH